MIFSYTQGVQSGIFRMDFAIMKSTRHQPQIF
jgi:hypothetical protein